MQKSKPQIIIHRHGDLLLRPEIALGRLDRRMPQKELDLLEIAAVLPAEFGAGCGAGRGRRSARSRSVWMTVQLSTRPPSRSGCRD